MTKVKTILKEFCSAKDILAINRLGLLSKGEERESQPIPWRHRLKRGERKELVRSEMRMSLHHRPSSTQSAKDKAKAVSTAQSPQLSKMGELLIHEHSKDSSGLGEHLNRLNNEKRRSQHEMYHTRRSFLQQSKTRTLNREPMILVERPPHPNVRTRAAFMQRHGVDPELVSIPSYQRPLLTRARTPSTLTTIEAFTVETRKKRNVWEEAMEDKEQLKFKSTSIPSARLTDQEVRQLKIGHTIHKPTPESIVEPRKPVKHKKPKPKVDEEGGGGVPMLRRSSSDIGTGSAVFLTEISRKHSATESRSKARAILYPKKSSSTNASNAQTQTKYPYPPAVPHGIAVHKSKKVTNPGSSKIRRSLSAGAADTRGSNHFTGKKAVRHTGTKQQSNHASVSDDLKTKGKKLKDFLSVLLEEEGH